MKTERSISISKACDIVLAYYNNGEVMEKPMVSDGKMLLIKKARNRRRRIRKRLLKARGK